MGQALTSLVDLGGPPPETRGRRIESSRVRRSTLPDDRGKREKSHHRPRQRASTSQIQRGRSEHDRRERHPKHGRGSTRSVAGEANAGKRNTLIRDTKNRVGDWGVQTETTSSRSHRERRRVPNAEPRHKDRSNKSGKLHSRHAHAPPNKPHHTRHQHSSKSKSNVHIEVTELKPPRERKRKDCMVCAESLPIRRFSARTPTAQCTHEVNTCRHCLRTWIRSEFKTKMWDQLDCPECRTRLEYEDMKAFAPSEIFRRYDRLSTRATLEAIPGFQWCIAKGCKSGQIHGEGNVAPRFRCMACRASHCIVHQIPWHKGETCAEYDHRTDDKIKKAEESASKKLIRELAKKCPGCKRNIEKNQGCDHMTCSKCRHEFCWLCLAPWGPIRNQGTRMHRATCTLYWEG